MWVALSLPPNAMQANKVIDALCEEVKRGEAVGNSCQWICDRHYTLLNYYEGGSKTVLKMRFNDTDRVFKMKHRFSHEYKPFDATTDDEKFTKKVLKIVTEELLMDWPRYEHHLIKILWPSHKYPLSDIEKQNLWMLLQGGEYIKSKVLFSTSLLPKVKGTCGHMYQVERLIPFKNDHSFTSTRAVFIHLIETLKLLYSFLNEPLRLCDLKSLGLSPVYLNRFMIMDADTLFTELKLNETLVQKRCSTDEHCNIFECHSKCNMETGHCTRPLNNNWDVFCNKFIKPLFGIFWSSGNAYLDECYNSKRNSNEIRNFVLYPNGFL